MTKKSNLIKFYIPAEVYDSGIVFIFSEDKEAVAKYINKSMQIPATVETLECRGMIFRKVGHNPTIWMPRIPITIGENGTLVHELLHAVKWILHDWAGVGINEDGEEAYCHLISYFFKQTLINFDNIDKKKKINVKKRNNG